MRSFPWDSIVEAIGDDGYPILDRACSAEDLREVVETFFTNGVFMDTDQAFTVTPDEGMSVIVSPGKCLINGTVGYETSERKLALQGPSSQDRIDTIVLRWNANIDARLIDLYVRTGVAADVPTRPALVRNNTVYELGIQDIYVSANAGTIVQQRMTDTRLENERCGAVLPFASIDTTTFYAQIQAAIDSQIAELQAQTDRAVELAQSAIDGTTAGNLQNQIDDLSEEVTNNYSEFDSFRETMSKSPVLWEGSWSSGSITVPGISDATLVGVLIHGGAYMTCTVSQDLVIGGTTYPTSDKQHVTAAFKSARSGDVLTFDNSTTLIHYPSGNHSATKSFTVDKIIRIV